MKPRRRTILKVIALLLAWGAAGAALNVAVAWGLAAKVHLSRPSDSKFSDTYLHSGKTTQALIRRYDAPGTTRLSMAPGYLAGQRPMAELITPYWAELRIAAAIESLSSEGIHATGWPLRTALFRFHFDPHGDLWRLEVEDGIVIDSSVEFQELGGNYGRDLQTLPLRPIWPGFAINTVFYAGVLWMLFCGPFALRRMIRRRAAAARPAPTPSAKAPSAPSAAQRCPPRPRRSTREVALILRQGFLINYCHEPSSA